MAVDDFAAISDVETIWGSSLVGADRGRVQARIEQASAMIRQADPLVGGLSIDERAAASPSFGIVVRGVVVDMVHRLLMNPQARREVAVDDARVVYDTAVSTGQMYLSDKEWQTLFADKLTAPGKAFMINPASPVFESTWSPWR